MGKMCKKRRILQAEQVEVLTPRRRAQAQGTTSVDGAEWPAPPATDGRGGLEIFFTPARAVQNAPSVKKADAVCVRKGAFWGETNFAAK